MTPLDHAYRAVIEERIRELLAYRRWYRANRKWANGSEWREMARDDYQELRSLVRLARKARRIEAKADRDAIAFAKWEAERNRDSWTLS